MSPELFVKRWGANKPGPAPEGPSAKKMQRLKDNMTDKRAAVDSHTAAYVQAALEYGVELTRSEYRPLANRNWKTIQRFGVRLMRGLLALAAILVFLGWQTLKTTDDIQHDRKNSVLQKCEAGEHFDQRLRAHLRTLPEPERAQATATLKFTEELVGTIVPISHDHCATALRQAGL